MLLDLGYCKVFGSKMEAVFTLTAMTGTNIPYHAATDSNKVFGKLYSTRNNKSLSADDFFQKYLLPAFSGIIPNEDDMSITPPGVQNLIYGNMLSPRSYRPPNLFFGDPSGYDWADMYIKEMGRKLNIDTIVMQRCTGVTRLITEIVSLRTAPYDYLCRRPESDSLPINQLYPTIWFPTNGIITRTDDDKFVLTNDFTIENDTIVW